MPSFTLSRPDLYPAGTTVNAYHAANWSMALLPPTGAPVGSSSASAVATATGVTFAGLLEDAAYYAYALVSGAHQYVRFVVDTEPVRPQSPAVTLIPEPPVLGRDVVIATTFRAGHGFAKSGGTGPVGVDDSSAAVIDALGNGPLGPTAYKMTTPSDGTTQNHVKTAISPVLDFTARYVTLRVKVSDIANLTMLQFYLSSDNLSANFGWAGLAPSFATYKPLRSNEWVTLNVPWEGLNPTGAPNRAAVNAIQMKIQSTNGVPVDVHVSLIGARNQAASAVTLMFDDGWLDHYTVARAKMDQYRMRGVTVPICDRLDGRLGQVGGTFVTDAGDTVPHENQYMALRQLRSLVSDHGWEAGVHAYTLANHDVNWNVLTPAKLAAELESAKAWARSEGLGPADHGAYPFGAYDPLVTIPVAARYLRSVRSTTTAVEGEVWPSPSPHRLRSYMVGSTTTLANVQAEVTKAINNKLWLILGFHKLPVSATLGTDWPRATFDSFIDWLATQAIPVRTCSEQFDQAIP